MKRNFLLFLTAALMLALPAEHLFAAGSHSTPCYFDGKTLNVDSGCTLHVLSGGALTLDSGSTETNAATNTSTGNATWSDGKNIVLGTTTGSKIGTATTQKLAFFNSTPIVQNGATVDIITGLQNLGLFAAGTHPINKVTLTAPATGSTLTIADGKTLTANNNVTLAGGDGSTVAVAANKTLTVSNTMTLAGGDSTSATFPNAPFTAARTDAGQTFTGVNTFTGTVLNGPVPVACGGTCTLGTANLGTYTRLDTAAGSVATLPGATGTGNVYRLYVSVANSSNSDKVLTNPVTDTIIGTAQGENAGTAKFFVGNALTAHSIQMPFAGTQPSGGFVGDTIVCTDVASTIWKCDIQYQAGTTPTTPYSASTS